MKEFDTLALDNNGLRLFLRDLEGFFDIRFTKDETLELINMRQLYDLVRVKTEWRKVDPLWLIVAHMASQSGSGLPLFRKEDIAFETTFFTKDAKPREVSHG